MIVLDTNVISELMRSKPSQTVIAWLDAQPSSSIWTSSVCVFEVRMGLSMLDEGTRRRSLEKLFDQVIREDLSGRVLDLDTAAALAAAEIAAEHKANGRGTEFRDVMIAGTVAARRGVLATRNTRHFDHAGITLINPWDGDGKPGQ